MQLNGFDLRRIANSSTASNSVQMPANLGRIAADDPLPIRPIWAGVFEEPTRLRGSERAFDSVFQNWRRYRYLSMAERQWKQMELLNVVDQQSARANPETLAASTPASAFSRDPMISLTARDDSFAGFCPENELVRCQCLI
jgi:hypothetical protein